MTLPSTQTASYTDTAKFFHWLIGLLIIFMLVLGFCLGLFQGHDKFLAFQIHKSVGITILLLSLLRLLWRFTHRPPPHAAHMTRAEAAIAHVVHYLLYFLMIAMPLSGWAMVSASAHNIPTILYGVIPWPAIPIAPDDKPMVDDITDKFHYYAAWILAVLAAGHIAAAWKHHLFDRDGVLLQMAPRRLHGLLLKIGGPK